jgi:hypothetical protein
MRAVRLELYCIMLEFITTTALVGLVVDYLLYEVISFCISCNCLHAFNITYLQRPSKLPPKRLKENKESSTEMKDEKDESGAKSAGSADGKTSVSSAMELLSV